MIKEIKKNNGFVILFAVTIAAILLSISLGVAEIALKETKFGTNARDTNDAFFAADSGIEKVLLSDKPSGTSPGIQDFIVTGLGSTGNSCATVRMEKVTSTNPNFPGIQTTVISKGYNVTGSSCGDPSISNLIQRELKVTY